MGLSHRKRGIFAGQGPVRSYYVYLAGKTQQSVKTAPAKVTKPLPRNLSLT
jgi:hypothetical protein